MNRAIKENYQKVSKRADYNDVMRLTNLDAEKDPVKITHGHIFNTVEYRDGNYHLKPSVNLVFDCHHTDSWRIKNSHDIEQQALLCGIKHLEEKLKSNEDLAEKMIDNYDVLLSNHIALQETHQDKLEELKSKQKLLEDRAHSNQKNYPKAVRDKSKGRRMATFSDGGRMEVDDGDAI